MATPEEVQELVDKHWLDRKTKADDLIAEAVLVLMDQRKMLDAISLGIAELAGVAPDELGVRPNFFFSYPEDGETTEFAAGTMIINFSTGNIQLPTGKPAKLTDNLYNHSVKYARSLMITTDRTVYVRLDDQNAFPVPPGQLSPFYNQQFTKLSIRITAPTYMFILASTSPEGIGITQHTGILESHGYNRNKTVAVGSTVLATAYANANLHEVQAYIGRLATNGFILNKDATELLYLWISIDGETFYDTDIGLDIDYVPVLPGTAFTIHPRTLHSVKIGASANNADYAVILI